jgi:hypothetical protein
MVLFMKVWWIADTVDVRYLDKKNRERRAWSGHD